MASSTITTLFLDVGGVLLTNGWDRYSRADAAEKFGLDPDVLDDRHKLTFNTYELGNMSLDEYLDGAIFHKKRSFSRQEFKEFMLAQSQPHTNMLDFIKALKKKHGLRITVVSNEGRELNTHRIQTFGLHDFVDAFISSSYVHHSKPDKAIFQRAIDISMVQPEEVVYIDDRPFFISVAKNMGLNGIIHKNAEDTRTQLANFNLEV